MTCRLRRVEPAAAVSIHAEPHAQQQPARDLEVERADMGQRGRPQSFAPGLLCAAARFGFAVLKHNVSLLEGLDFTLLYFPDRVIIGYPYSSTIME